MCNNSTVKRYYVILSIRIYILHNIEPHKKFDCRMQIFWIEFIILLIIIFIYSLYTLVFIFWSIYLIDAVKRKRIYYKRTLRCLQRDNLHQQALAYNAKTELVKYSFLFCINLVEWFSCVFSSIKIIINIVHEYKSKTPSTSMNTSSDPEYSTPVGC